MRKTWIGAAVAALVAWPSALAAAPAEWGADAFPGLPARAVAGVPQADVEPFDCVPDPTTACLLGGRFQARVDWTRPNGVSGAGQRVPFTDQAVLFYFFEEENLEMLLKMVNGCGVNGKYWVFFGATSNVEFTVTVTDSQTGAVRAYPNPQGMPAEPIQDGGAFENCP